MAETGADSTRRHRLRPPTEPGEAREFRRPCGRRGHPRSTDRHRPSRPVPADQDVDPSRGATAQAPPSAPDGEAAESSSDAARAVLRRVSGPGAASQSRTERTPHIDGSDVRPAIEVVWAGSTPAGGPSCWSCSAAVVGLVAPCAGGRRSRSTRRGRQRRSSPAVVRIDTTIDYQHAIGAGTGIVLDPGGQVLTNFHVVQGADRITATVARPVVPRRSGRLRPRARHRGHPVARRRRACPPRPIGDSHALVAGRTRRRARATPGDRAAR